MRFNPNAPGCWGSAITNDPKSEQCAKCAFLKNCSDTARDNLLIIHKEMDVSKELGRYQLRQRPASNNTIKRVVKNRDKVKTHKLNENQVDLVSRMPKKAAVVVEQVFKKGIDCKLELNSGSNPFENKRPEFMRIPCQLLLEKGGFTRESLKGAFDFHYLHWSAPTVKSHASIAIRALLALEVIENSGNFYRIRQ